MARLELMQHALVQGASPAEAARYARSALPTDGAEPPPAPARPEVGPVPVDATGDPRPAPADVDDRPIRAGGGTLRMPGAGPRARGLARAVLAMDPVAARGLLEESIDEDGTIRTWNEVARPVLGAVGQRWAASGRGVEVEHLLSECLIAVFGARALVAGASTARPILLAGMPAELHCVPLVVLAAVLAERGVAARLLGPALPASALVAAIRRTAPAAVVLWSQLAATADVTVLVALPVTRPRFRTYVAGPGWDGAALPRGVDRLGSLAEAEDRIAAAVLR
jgi:hypothetical protein